MKKSNLKYYSLCTSDKKLFTKIILFIYLHIYKI